MTSDIFFEVFFEKLLDFCRGLLYHAFIIKERVFRTMSDKAELIVDMYASKAFNDAAMRKYLPGDTYKQLKKPSILGVRWSPAWLISWPTA